MSQVALTYSRREWIIELLLLLAEGLLVWMVADLFFAPFTSASNPLPLWMPIGLMFLAGVLPRLLHDWGIWNRSFAFSMLTAIILSPLATIKIVAFPAYAWFDTAWLRQAIQSLIFAESTADIAVWAPIALSASVWWLARFNGPPGLERCRMTLLAATVVTALVSIAAYVVLTGPTDKALSLAIVTVFAVTLTALAIARQGHEATHSGSRLFTTVLLPTVAIVAATTLFASIVTFDGLRSSSAVLSFLDVVLEPFFQLLVLVLTVLVIVISLPLVWLLSLGNYQGSPRVMDFGANGPTEPAQSMLDWQPPDPVRLLLAFLVLLVVFYGLLRFGLALTRRDFDPLETGEREFGSGKGFGAWLDRFRGRFGRSISHDPLAELRKDPAWANTVIIRETYARWLQFAEARKLGRAASETAVELDLRASPSLQIPGSAALDELTAIYNDVRYALVPATADQAERALRAWDQLQSTESVATKP